MEKLKFKPVTEGLGFHPFSDGLPYAPATKAPTAGVARPARLPQSAVVRMGTGATVAGPVSWKAPTTTPQAQPQPAATEERFGIVYLFERVTAYLLDSALMLSGLAAGASYYLAHFATPSGRDANVQDWAYILLVIGTLHWALITFQEVAFGTTIGKRVFRLAIPGSAAAVFLRAFFFVPSLIFAGIGLIPALFDRKRRCLHDLIVDTQPEHIP